MKKLLAFAFLATTATTTALGHAESLEDKKFWKGQTDYINKRLEKSEKACGVKLALELVDKEKIRTEAEKHKHSVNGICGAIIDEVATLCRKGEDEKAAVKAKITALKCGYANPRTLDLKSGTLTYMGNNEESNFSDWARPWLMKHL
jgi:hypothetical protein